MNSSFTQSQTFTITHAKQLAAKVATDLKRIQRFYSKPLDSWIDAYEEEMIALLKAGYLDKIIYGFQRDGDWIEPTIRYTAEELDGSTGTDNDPGKIRPGKDVSNSSFTSFLTYSSKWQDLSSAQQNEFKDGLSMKRGYGAEPGMYGYLVNDLSYSSGTRTLNRSSLKSY